MRYRGVGIWVLKSDARPRKLLANLDHRRVEWRKQGSYETALVTRGHDCLCSYACGLGAAVRPQTNDSVWDGVIGLWSSTLRLSPRCARGPTGVNQNRHSGVGSCIPWRSDNESSFDPQNLPKLTVSTSLGHSVEFEVRRARDEVPSTIQLDHGDLLVVDGLAHSEYCTPHGVWAAGSSG